MVSSYGMFVKSELISKLASLDANAKKTSKENCIAWGVKDTSNVNSLMPNVG